MIENNKPLTIMTVDSIGKCDPIDFIESVGFHVFENSEHPNIDKITYSSEKVVYDSRVIFIFDDKKTMEFCNNDSSAAFCIKARLFHHIGDILENNGFNIGTTMADGRMEGGKYYISAENPDYFAKLENFVNNIQDEIDRRNTKQIE